MIRISYRIQITERKWKESARLFSVPRWSLDIFVILPNYSNRKEKKHGSEEERKSLHYV